MSIRKAVVCAVAVLGLSVSSSFAGYNYFSVIESGKGEATFGLYNGDPGLKIRYGLMNNLELYSSYGSAGFELLPGTLPDLPAGMEANIGEQTNYVLGVRYQIIPMLSAFLDVGVPTVAEKGYRFLGFVPGVNFTVDFAEKFSVGTVAQLGIVMADEGALGEKSTLAALAAAKGVPDAKNTPAMNLKIGAEIDYAVTENITLWLGVDYEMIGMTMEKRADLVGKDKPLGEETPISLSFGASFGSGGFSVGTLMGLKFNHPVYEDTKDYSKQPDLGKEGKKSIGLWGGVELGIGF